MVEPDTRSATKKLKPFQPGFANLNQMTLVVKE
jgi:hypothetical protein